MKENFDIRYLIPQHDTGRCEICNKANAGIEENTADLFDLKIGSRSFKLCSGCMDQLAAMLSRNQSDPAKSRAFDENQKNLLAAVLDGLFGRPAPAPDFPSYCKQIRRMNELIFAIPDYLRYAALLAHGTADWKGPYPRYFDDREDVQTFQYAKDQAKWYAEALDRLHNPARVDYIAYGASGLSDHFDPQTVQWLQGNHVYIMDDVAALTDCQIMRMNGATPYRIHKLYEARNAAAAEHGQGDKNT